jgi:hypothetical protein
MMTKMIRILLFSFLVILQLSCASEKPCTLKLEQAPELRGLRLGMSVSDIQKRFPGFPAVSGNEVGIATVEISDIFVRNVLDQPIGDKVVSFVSAGPFPELKGIKHIELKLTDGRVTEITVYYARDINWKSADEFAQKTSETLKLDGSWRKVGQDSDYSEVRSMQCGGAMKGEGFIISSGFRKPTLENPKLEETKLPYVQLEDMWAGQMTEYERNTALEEKKKREDEERKNTFRP